MTAWPNPDKPGYPQNPERDGAHRILFIGSERVWLWVATREWWIDHLGHALTPLQIAQTQMSGYHGPLITPADHAALVAAAVEAMRQSAEDVATRDGNYATSANIRAISLPSADVLARYVAASVAAAAEAMREACRRAAVLLKPDEEFRHGLALTAHTAAQMAVGFAIEAIPIPSADALARRDAEERDRLAKLVEAMIGDRTHAGERAVLAIAARTIRRGRHLTGAEQLENLRRAMREADDEAAIRARAVGEERQG